MQEATGELNMTVITVVAIAAVAAFFYAFVWPAIKNNINRNTNCSQSWGCTSCDGSTCTCQYCADEGGGSQTTCQNVQPITCPDQSGSASGGGTPS